jgi:hypothetical protein
MTLGDQLRAVLNEEAGMRTATRPDLQRLISGGRARRRRRNAVWAAGSVLAAVIAAGGVYGLAQLGGHDADSRGEIANQTTPQPLPDTDEAVAIAAGTYAIPADGDGVVAPYTITVPAGWETQHGTDVGKNGDQPRAIGIETFALDKIQLADDTCTGDETFGTPQTSAAGLAAALRAQGHGLRVSDPVAATVGRLSATRIDLDYPGSEPLSNCRLPANDPGAEAGWLQVWTGYLVLRPAESASAYVVDVGGRAQVFVTVTGDEASAADRAELQSILDSISFQTAE